MIDLLENLAENAKPFQQTAQDADLCSICMEDFSNGSERVAELNCSSKHLFHLECLKQWVSTNKKTCPMCRELI